MCGEGGPTILRDKMLILFFLNSDEEICTYCTQDIEERHLFKLELSSMIREEKEGYVHTVDEPYNSVYERVNRKLVWPL